MTLWLLMVVLECVSAIYCNELHLNCYMNIMASIIGATDLFQLTVAKI